MKKCPLWTGIPIPGDHFSFRFYAYPYHFASSTFLSPLNHNPEHSNIVWKLPSFKEAYFNPLSISSLPIISLLVTKAKLLKPHSVFINHAVSNPHHYTKCVLFKIIKLNPHCQIREIFWPLSCSTSTFHCFSYLYSWHLLWFQFLWHHTLIFSLVSPSTHSPAPWSPSDPQIW